jgi:hypothetical protein
VTAERRTGHPRRAADATAAWVGQATLAALALALAAGGYFAVVRPVRQGTTGGPWWWAWLTLCGAQLVAVVAVLATVLRATLGADPGPTRRAAPFGTVDPALLAVLGAGGVPRAAIQARAETIFRRRVQQHDLPDDRLHAFAVMRTLWADAETEAVGEYAVALAMDDLGRMPTGAW